MATIQLTVNGKQHTIEAQSDIPLLWAIRDKIGLKGTKYGCGIAQCGACMVVVNGQPTYSCVIPATAMTGQNIETIEAEGNPVKDALQEAWRELKVAQCGYCQSGQIMSAVGLVQKNRNPSREEIDSAMSGNVCRCASYNRIREGIEKACSELQK